jgi:hypothetical protein
VTEIVSHPQKTAGKELQIFTLEDSIVPVLAMASSRKVQVNSVLGLLHRADMGNVADIW